jgi:hypothetical protein
MEILISVNMDFQKMLIIDINNILIRKMDMENSVLTLILNG